VLRQFCPCGLRKWANRSEMDVDRFAGAGHFSALRVWPGPVYKGRQMTQQVVITISTR